jgi:hypothetical protein
VSPHGAQVDTGYTVKRLLNDNHLENHVHNGTPEHAHTRAMGSTAHHSRHTAHPALYIMFACQHSVKCLYFFSLIDFVFKLLQWCATKPYLIYIKI